MQEWLSTKKVDVIAIQEAQLPAKPVNIPGYSVVAMARRARGRMDGARAKGGDVAIYVRKGLNYDKISDAPIAANDDVTEWCGVRVFGKDSAHYIDIHNIYRPPIRTGDKTRGWTGSTRTRFSTVTFSSAPARPR